MSHRRTRAVLGERARLSRLASRGYPWRSLPSADRPCWPLRSDTLAKRWLLGTHHGAVGKKHLPVYLDEFVFRFNRRTARSMAHRFARVIQQAILTPPTTHRDIVAGPAT